jgi:hypothetical protein
MTTARVLVSVFQVVISVAAGLTAFRLWHSGLYRRYPVLSVYMTFQAVYSLFPEVFDTRGPAYFWMWVCGQPIAWLLDILVVRELCRVVPERHPGLFTLGRWVMYFGVVVAGFLSFLSLLPHIKSTMPARSKLLGYWVAANRGVSLSLAIFLLLMLLAVSRYPVRLSRNVILNAVLFTLSFLCDSLGAILYTIFDVRLNPSVRVALLGVEAACFALWFFCLTPAGEQAHFDWIHFDPKYEERVMAQLDALNRVLKRGA